MKKSKKYILSNIAPNQFCYQGLLLYEDPQLEGHFTLMTPALVAW